MDQRRDPLVRSVGAAVLAYFVANTVEVAFIRAFHPPGFELRWISDALLSAAFGLVAYLWLHLRAVRTTLSRLEREQIVLDTQLSLAADIQRNGLPAIPTERDGVRLAARLQSAGRIGGDFYDFLDLEPGRLLLFVGDVSGKGVPAALLLTGLRTMFRMAVAETHDPGEVVGRLSRVLYEENGGRLYLTCLLAHLDLPAWTLTYVNAGHPSGLVLDKSGQHLLDACGPPAGMFPSSRYESQSVGIKAGAIGVFVTDGITEAIEDGDLTAPVVIARAIETLSGDVTPERICDELIALAGRGLGPMGAGGATDDRTALAFVVDGQS
jgi:phosphoserine phosphatase RsbU/P